MDSRLRALCDLTVPEAREGVGLHEYDGVVQDLSPTGVAAGLARLGGPSYADPYDEAQASAGEQRLKVELGELELHRSNPLYHLANLDLAGYDREYAPAAERAAARDRHLAAWPDGVDAALAALDRVAAPVANALLGPVRGLTADLDPERDAAALAAHARLVAHLEAAAADGPPDPALGAPAFARLLGSAEGLTVDTDVLAGQADAERDRLLARLAEDCARLRPGQPTAATVAELLADHPDPDGVLAEARDLTAEVVTWTAEQRLVPYDDGVCLVGPAPPSRRWAVAMLAPAAPYETDAASWFHVTPPDAAWPAPEQEEWLRLFSRTTLPAICLHEVAPGHFSHFRAMRHAQGDVRRTVTSDAFIEGWAHYTEELAVEEGFRAGDPRMAIGVWLEALVRVTRLTCAIGIHTGGMTVGEAAGRFTSDAFLAGPAARSEAERGMFDPTYGRYTWGKLAILDARERAREAWGAGYSHGRFHAALLSLGSPGLGLLDSAVPPSPE